MIILGIETSCDETAVSIVKAEGDIESPRFELLGSALFSQVALHAEHGGVVPNLAKREHARNLVPLFEKALKEADLLLPKKQEISEGQKKSLAEMLNREPSLYDQLIIFLSENEKPEIDAIAVTEGPGLAPALWVGINFARALAQFWNLPLIPTNHMEGHIVSPLMQSSENTVVSGAKIPATQFPLLALLISGGHTELVHAEKWGSYKILGQTRDDAVGEAYDKVARMMNLPYPGGPEISKLADKARKTDPKENAVTEVAENNVPIALPRPMINSNDFAFSFSGLKTAVLYLIKKLTLEKNPQTNSLTETQKEKIALEFETAVIEVLIAKTKRALEEHSAKTLIVAGGVIANTAIRAAFENLAKEFPETTLLIPTKSLSTDNATMIAMAGFLRYIQAKGRFTPETSIKAEGNLKLS